MKKGRKSKTSDSSRTLRRVAIHTTGLVLFSALLTFAYAATQQRVEREVLKSKSPPRVVFLERPAWMSDGLLHDLTESVQPDVAKSPFDRDVLARVSEALSQSPWIKSVKQVRRVYGEAPGDTILVDAEFRAPVALVHSQDYFWLVDGEGVKLPQQFSLPQLPRIMRGMDRMMNLRIIEGVRAPVVNAGKKWPGEDLQAGLELARALYGQGFADDIEQIDVANFNGRRNAKEPHIILKTRFGTEVRWGRPITSKDFFVEVPASRKIAVLTEIHQKYGRIDANRPWIDIRFDRITYPNPQASLDARP